VQAAIALDLGRHLRAVIVFDANEPATDDGGPLGPFTVGGLPASSWNREQARAALAGVYVEGNLPPARVRIRAARSGSYRIVARLGGARAKSSKVRLG